MSDYLNDLMSEKTKFKRENEQLRELSEGVKFEKSDEKALIIAALITTLPVLIIGCLMFYFVMWIIFMR